MQRKGEEQMGEIEFRVVTPEEMIKELETMVTQMPRDKYTFQVGIRDVKFAFDKERAEALVLGPEMTEIDKAEMYLRMGHLVPVEFAEDDGTVHQVLEWDPAVVATSGFMGCVAHSMVTTDQGIFEVGRYPAINIEDFSKTWQWFIHQRIEAVEESASPEGRASGLTNASCDQEDAYIAK